MKVFKDYLNMTKNTFIFVYNRKFQQKIANGISFASRTSLSAVTHRVLIG